MPTPISYMLLVLLFVVPMLLLGQLYFDAVLGRMNRRPNRYPYIIVFVVLHLIYYLVNMPSALSSLLAIVMILSLALSYRVQLGTLLVFTFIYVVLQTIVNSMGVHLFFGGIDYSIETPYQLMQSQYTRSIKLLLFSFLVMLMISQLIRLISRRRSIALQPRYYLLFLIVPVISIWQINVLFAYSQQNSYYVISVLGLLFLNVFVIYMFDMLMERFRLLNQNVYLQQQMDYQDANYEKTVHTFKDIKRIIHDTNQHLIYIEECIRRQEPEAAIEHIHTTLNRVDQAYYRVNTGNLVIDALVSNTLSIGQSNGIRIDTRLRLHSPAVRIERYDLCVVLGNLLDNAIEASKQIRLADDRYISINIHSSESTLYIHITNHSSQSDIDWTSSKPGDGYHGLGLTNISRLCDKYGGHMTIESHNHRVESMVVLPFYEE
ncbi:sensor histidine kinase [Paenibacillus wulumuqiensis]|uniref:sensor histidine kinase n=1 Tax=Paenibacillus wulumuqiensis TaxID=1567107 RepID=UPI000619BE29|nr:sensor histidine kinase [Paenibacillus wulumuqiensis]